jgi:hypothetical protein
LDLMDLMDLMDPLDLVDSAGSTCAKPTPAAGCAESKTPAQRRQHIP